MHFDSINLKQERNERVEDLSKSVQPRDWVEFTASTKNSNMHCACCVEIALLLMLLSAHVTSVLFLVFNFVLINGFYWSYTLLLKSPVLMRSWLKLYPN